jgi:hypothetical protein
VVVAALGAVAATGFVVIRCAEYAHESEPAPLFHFIATAFVALLAGACTHAIDPNRPRAWIGSVAAGVVSGALFMALMFLVIVLSFEG